MVSASQFQNNLNVGKIRKGKKQANPITGREGPWGCGTSRLPHRLDHRLTDGGEVSLTRRLPFTPHENSWCSFLIEAGLTPEP
jgi:hypothetical protein